MSSPVNFLLLCGLAMLLQGTHAMSAASASNKCHVTISSCTCNVTVSVSQ